MFQTLWKKQTPLIVLFFASHCTPLDDSSKIPETQTFITGNKLFSSQFADQSLWCQSVEKKFKTLIFNSLFEYINRYNLLSAHQSGFGAKYSCVNQLLSIVHGIYTAFDAYPTLESHAVFFMCPRILIKLGIKDLFLSLKVQSCKLKKHK